MFNQTDLSEQASKYHEMRINLKQSGFQSYTEVIENKKGLCY